MCLNNDTENDGKQCYVQCYVQGNVKITGGKQCYVHDMSEIRG